MEKRLLPNVASFLVSEDCNLACTYCFELEGRENCNKHMTKEVARKGVEYLCENAIANGDNNFGAMLFGGEPLLKPDIVEEILKHGVELAEKNNITFTANMVTNATILTDKIKYILSKYMHSAQLNVQLSVDGVKDIHDKCRVTKNGKGSFDMVAKNIEGWKELFSDNIHALSIHGCSNEETIPRLFENYKFFREEWGVPRLWFIPINSDNYTKEHVKIYEEQLNLIADYTLKKAKEEGSIQEVLNYAPIDRCMNPDVRPSAPCGAGKNFVSITANGEIYPCHSFYYNDPEKSTKIGDVWKGIEEPKRKIFVDYGNEDMSCDKDCPGCEAYHCYRCIADNWVENGSIFSQITGFKCEMSNVERKVQLRVKGELIKMGLLNNNSNNNSMDNMPGNNPDNPACLCDARTYDGDPQMHLRNEAQMHNRGEEGHKCNCSGEEGCAENKSDDDVLAFAVKVILDKIEALEAGQNLILKRFLD